MELFKSNISAFFEIVNQMICKEYHFEDINKFVDFAGKPPLEPTATPISPPPKKPVKPVK